MHTLAERLIICCVQDFAEAIEDFNKVIELDPSLPWPILTELLSVTSVSEYELSQTDTYSSQEQNNSLNLSTASKQQSLVAPSADASTAKLKDNERAYEHELIVRDYDKVIQLNPGYVYAYFNRGNLRCVQRDFRAAIED